MTYEFTVLGNHENPYGNPIPYYRMTQGTKWTPGARRYGSWKDYVASEFERQTGMRRTTYKSKPIVLGKGDEARVEMDIEWSNGTHADADNVFKGILDALFSNDKNVTSGSFESRMSKDRKGKVIIKITIKNHD